MIDLHSHILPGLDDGARTIEESLDIAREAVANGVSAIAATPHVREDYPTSAAAMEEPSRPCATQSAQAAIPIRVLAGGEDPFDQLELRSIEELRRFGLGGNPSYLLVETPYLGWPLGIEQSFERLRAAGITPVLAHPERNPIVQASPERLRAVVQSGALVQVTASSLDRGTSQRVASLCARTDRERRSAPRGKRRPRQTHPAHRTGGRPRRGRRRRARQLADRGRAVRHSPRGTYPATTSENAAPPSRAGRLSPAQALTTPPWDKRWVGGTT